MAYTYKIKQGSTEVKTGTTTTEDFEYNFPQNTGTTDIVYTIEAIDDSGCSATTSVTVSSGSECQETSADHFYIMVSSTCGIPNGTVFSIEFVDCGVKEYVTTGDSYSVKVEFEGTSDCDYTDLMNGIIVSTGEIIEPNNGYYYEKGESYEIRGILKVVYFAINNLIRTRTVDNGDDTSTIYCKFLLSSESIAGRVKLEIKSDIYVKETYNVDCKEAETGNYYQITTEPDYDTYVENYFDDTATFYTKEFKVATLPTYSYCKGTKYPIILGTIYLLAVTSEYSTNIQRQLRTI